MDLRKHPWTIILKPLKEILEKRGGEFTVTFKYYIYDYKTKTNIKVDNKQIPLEKLTDKFVEKLLTKLKPNEEVALCSTISSVQDGTRLHIPMLDMAVDRLFPFRNEFDPSRYAIFVSGRSFHIYGRPNKDISSFFQSETNRVDFLGKSLLLNPAKGEPIVDHRWIGHQLTQGHSALRWSANSDQHKHMPEIVDV